jgi:hypothetical protein
MLDSISLGSRSTGTGPTALTFYSSIDNYATAIGSASVSASSAWAFISTINFSGTLLDDSSGTPLAFRIYGSGGNGTQPTSANWRIDDISITTTSELTAVPEPTASGAIAGVWLLALCGWRVWRQRCCGEKLKS